MIFRHGVTKTHRARSVGGIAAIIGDMCQNRIPPTAYESLERYFAGRRSVKRKRKKETYACVNKQLQ